ncbi:MAG: class I SAM-dependent methyltransferase [Lachnospiraceae bacterium]|nr:class I SAM-dependent methyltransferase [Lachnospiraceae bacterium]
MKDYEALSRKHFDQQAAEYDARDTVYYSREGKISCRDIAAMLKDSFYDSLLDVGCGTGFLIDMLTQQRTARYTGLDLSAEMIKMAQRKNIPGAEFVNGTADELPFPDESFDIVTCSQSYHHYPYPEKAMSEAFRVLKRGGSRLKH